MSTQPTTAATPVQMTTNVAFSTAGAVDILLWIWQCIQAGEFVLPSNETLTLLALLTAPLAHAIYRGVMNRLNRWADGPAQTEDKV